jgi:molecular chaperone GrpE
MTDEGLSREIDPEISEIDNIEELRQILLDEKQQAGTNLAGWQRTQADFENYKKRSEQEKEEISKFANSVLILSLLPVLDDFERALDFLPSKKADAAWLEGLKLIERKLKSTLESQGLSAINALGEPFDPHLHEAIRQDKGEEGIVIEEIQKGYKFHDKVIRPSKVVVGNGEVDNIEAGD